MALTTRCPQCGSTFKVVADQLRIRNGLVRCGVCTSVFDGNRHLMGPAAPATALAAAPVPDYAADHPYVAPDLIRGRGHALRSDSVAHDESASFERASSYSEPTQYVAPEPYQPARDSSEWDRPAFVASDDAREDSNTQDSDDIAPIRADHPRGGLREPVWRDDSDEDDDDTVRGESRTRYVDDFHSGRTPPAFMDDGETARQDHRSSLWGVLCVPLLLVLIGLSVYTYRTQLATSVPALRPLLTMLCEPLACQVGYERRIERISVMSSSLRAPPGGSNTSANTHQLMLTVILRNRYNAPQHWPALILELKDLADRVVVRKNLLPTDYLPADLSRQPFGANAEQRVTVPISVRDAQVNGYQIDKFFP